MAISVYMPTNSERGFPFLHILSAFIVSRFLMMAILTGVRWYLWSFDLCFSNNEWCWTSFNVFISHLYVFEKNVCLGLLPTFSLGCLFFWYWDARAAYIFWRLILCQLFQLLLFFPILRVVFSPCLLFPLLCKSF